jgi:hypothetical protein
MAIPIRGGTTLSVRLSIKTWGTARFRLKSPTPSAALVERKSDPAGPAACGAHCTE